MPAFGALAGNLPDVHIGRSKLGQVIANNIARIPVLNPKLKVLQYAIMPDHIHLLIFVTDTIERHLGNYLGMFKVKTGQDYALLTGVHKTVFEEDFYDCILYPSRSLDQVYRYIKDNPRRLAVRKAYPEFFRKVNNLKIGDHAFQAYGNFQLLDNPFKEQVIVHRADSPEIREQNRQQWLYTGSNGGVLVSPFISPREKEIFREAEALGARFIVLITETMGERYKPSGHFFSLCEQGRMLLLSPVSLPDRDSQGNKPVTRRQALALNEFSRIIYAYARKL